MVKVYTPERGDYIWLNFDPQAGHEQKGRRPALVLSHFAYNKKVGLAICCPITSQEKGYPFEVKIKTSKLDGVILADQIRNLDWKARNAEFIEKTSSSVLNSVTEKINLIMN